MNQECKACLTEHRRHIEVFYVPIYSPEFNSDERLNAYFKQAIGPKVPVRTKAKLHAAANDHMNFIAANAHRIRLTSRPRLSVKYAA